ncbi:MAG TPA: hypothetical protein VE377_22890 [Candidatus Dormibacteraeota bacterium]|nr:hypothetical protein [Candidatus Dormibacteraeota bacterium]
MKRIAIGGIGIALFLSLAGVPASAQNQAPSNPPSSASPTSLGDYARQIRKEPEAKSKAKVFDNDNLPRVDKLSVVGTPSTPPPDNSAESKPAEQANAAAPAAATENKPPTDTSKMDEAGRQAAWKQWGERLAAQQQQIDLLQRELDVLQREYQVRAAAMYADAGNRLRNSGDWDKQDADYKQKIADKQKTLDDAKQKLDELQEEARKAGVPSSVREP